MFHHVSHGLDVAAIGSLLASGQIERTIPLWWLAALIPGVLALVTAFLSYKSIIAANPGNARMQEIAGYGHEGAYAYSETANPLFYLQITPSDCRCFQ